MPLDATDTLLQDEREQFLELLEERGVGRIAAELRVHYHDVIDAAFGEHVDEELVVGVRRMLAT
jgi:hypothetical protein